VKHFVSFALGIGVMVAALAYSISKVDVPQVWHELSRADYRMLPLFVLLLAG